MIHLSFEQENTLIKNLLLANDVPEKDAISLAAVVTHSDFTGTYSHGLSRLCIYLRQYMAGALVAQPEWKIVKDEGAAISFDCGGGSGIVAVNTVYDEVLKRARKYGVAAGTGRHSANIGCGGYYGHRMAEDNVIGIVMSNTYPCQAPYLGADRLIGTNPIIMGAPTSNPERPIVIDISTSGVAIGNQTVPVLTAVIGFPSVICLRRSKRGFVQKGKERLISHHPINFRVLGAVGDPGIGKFDNNIHGGEAFLHHTPGLGHMPGVPLYRVFFHFASFSLSLRYEIGILLL